VVLGAPVSARLARARSSTVWGVGAAFAVLALASPARADVSSWASVASGPTWLDDGIEKRSVASLQMEAGIGLPPSAPLIVGGLFDVTTHFGQGTDLGLLSRFATRGFVLGDWGGAIDLGGYERFWGRKSAGFEGKLVLGAPWGLELGLGGGFGTKDAKFFGFTLGVDFARLTVFRTIGENWFPNPYPAYRKVE
jgi:hypothetical protein